MSSNAGFVRPTDDLSTLEDDLPLDPEVGTDVSPMRGLPLTKYDWRDFLTYTSLPKPKLLTAAAYRALPVDSQQRREYNDARQRHHNLLTVVRTPAMRTVHTRLDRLMSRALAQGQEIKTGLLLSGSAFMGKTTCAKLYARDYENKLRRESPHLFEREGVDFTPVAIVKTPSPPGGRHGVTPMQLLKAMAAYYDVVVEKTPDFASLERRVLKAMKVCDTRLVIIDEINNLEDTKNTGQAVVTFIKGLMEASGAVFCLVGVDMHESSLLADAQTSGRLKYAPYLPYDKDEKGKDKPSPWAELILALESELMLHGHRLGSLATKEADYLHDRTQGKIGDLVLLLAEAAEIAVLEADDPEDERITRAVLDEATTSSGSQLHWEDMRRRRARG